MKRKFTSNHLLRYLYKETSAVETMAINDALSVDRNLFEEYEELAHAKRSLPDNHFTPSTSAIQNILGYSEQTAVETSH